MQNTLRLLASCVLIVALSTLSRAPHERLIMLIVEGARSDTIRTVVSSPSIPSLFALVSNAVGGELLASREVCSADSAANSVVGATADETTATVWASLERMSRPYLLVGITGTEASNRPSGVIFPGPNPADGFIGSNLGAIVNRNVIERGATPWPYSLAGSRLKEATDGLATNDRSAWIEISAPGGAEDLHGITRAYGLDDDTVYLSPVYTRYVTSEAATAEPYVADDPSTVVVSSRAGEYLARHVSDLAEARADAALAVARRVPWDLFVYVDRRIALAEAIDAGAKLAPGAGRGDASPNGDLSNEVAAAYVEVDDRVSRLVAAAGPRSIVLVVGVHAPSPKTNSVGWFAVAAPSASVEWLRSNVDDLAATVRYLLGLPNVGTVHPIAAIVAAYPTRVRRVVASAAHSSRAVVPLNGAALRELSSFADDAERTAVTATSQR